MTAKDNEGNKGEGNKYNKGDHLLSFLQGRKIRGSCVFD